MAPHYDPNRAYPLDLNYLEEFWADPKRRHHWSSWEEFALAIGCDKSTLERGRGKRGGGPQPITYMFIEAMAELINRVQPCDPTDLIKGSAPSTISGTPLHEARLLVVKHLIDDPEAPILSPLEWLASFEHVALCTRAKRLLVLRHLTDFGGYFERDGISGVHSRAKWQTLLIETNIQGRTDIEKKRLREIYDSSVIVRAELGDRLIEAAEIASQHISNIGIFYELEIGLHLLAFLHDRWERSILRANLKEAWNLVFRRLDEATILGGLDWSTNARVYCQSAVEHHRRIAATLQDVTSASDDILDLLDFHAVELLKFGDWRTELVRGAKPSLRPERNARG